MTLTQPTNRTTPSLRFLAGFAVLCAVLLDTSALDATGRWGLAILAAVLATAVAVEMVHHRSTVVDALLAFAVPRRILTQEREDDDRYIGLGLRQGT